MSRTALRVIVWASGWGAAAGLGMAVGLAVDSSGGSALGFWAGSLVAGGCIAAAGASAPAGGAAARARALVWMAASVLSASVAATSLNLPGAVQPRIAVAAGVAIGGAFGAGGTALLSRREVLASLGLAIAGAGAAVVGVGVMFVAGWLIIQPLFLALGRFLGAAGTTVVAWGGAGILGGTVWGIFSAVWSESSPAS